MDNFLSKVPKKGDRGLHVEKLQLKLNELNLSVGNPDGDFGNKTKIGLEKYQHSKGLDKTGEADEATLNSLGFEIGFDEADFESTIISIVDNSDIEKTFWANRGKAPYGFYYGMAIMFAKLISRLTSNDYIAKEITKSLSGYEKYDVLRKYDDVFSELGYSNNTEENRLTNLFALMFGLGMMESSGRHCCGWDRGKLDGWKGYSKPVPPTSVNSETGLFQTSYDIMDSVSSETRSILKSIMNNYSAGADGLLEYFSKGASCTDLNSENYGEGIGKEFQRLSKEAPAFSVELTAVALRNISGHWNPVIKKGDEKRGLQVKKECLELLTVIQKYCNEKKLPVEIPFTEPSTPAIAATSISDRPQKIKELLNVADTIGQRDQLQKLFDTNVNSKANYWAVVDFNKPSSEERLFIFNLKNGSFNSYIVTHGMNSGELYAEKFSNEHNSHQSSLGIYKTGKEYQGKHGRSLFLDGLNSSNDNAMGRKIVIHQADYAKSDYRGSDGAGRSWGCFAVNPVVINEVIDCLKDGSYLIAWHK